MRFPSQIPTIGNSMSASYSQLSLEDEGRTVRKNRYRGLSCRDILVAAISATFGAVIALAFSTRTRTASQDFSSDVPIALVERVFTYNKSFVGNPVDGDDVQANWDSLVPIGRGTVEEPAGSHNFYTLSVIHQLHCLWSLQQMLYSSNPDTKDSAHQRHVRHCVDYLRQGLMCAADTTLEPVDPALGGVTGWGDLRKCRDFNGLKSWAEKRRASNERGFRDR